MNGAETCLNPKKLVMGASTNASQPISNERLKTVKLDQFRVSQKKLKAFKRRVSEIFRRNRGVSMKKRFAEFRSYAIGWLGYFQLDQVKTTFSTLDKWLRRRVRACYWKQWKKSKTRLRNLMSLGLSYWEARPFAFSGKGPWRLSKTSGVQRALSSEYLKSEGILSLLERWQQLASSRRIARVADPHAR
ncbi:group II intron maturase-specific domain-containing protein [Novipirellula maiorica]|uniref:group II intron maturase-specific domain-containing protein n=1 Tax=Novipirellula maiorica TaxID=1265734 RepID=UPI0026BD0D1A|nr:group II intron maturase-specific domain-containing protein [Rhodopirellula maiorica]